MQNCGMAHPFVTWAEGLSTKTVGEDLFWPSRNFGPKTALNLSGDVFFWSLTNFGQENGLGLGVKKFHSGLHYSQIFWPPPFENPANATAMTILFQINFIPRNKFLHNIPIF